MKYDFIYPNKSSAEKLSLDFTNKLKESLAYLLIYCQEDIDEDTSSKARNIINCINDRWIDYWYITAINRRLCDLVIKKRFADVLFYFKQLISLRRKEKKRVSLVPVNRFNRVQQALFTFYSTELSWSEKHIFYPVSESYYHKSEMALGAALDVIEQYLPDFYDEHQKLINAVVLYKSAKLSSGTTFSLGKCMYLRNIEEFNKRSVLIFIDRIVHETAHMVLHLLSKDDPFVLNPTGSFYPSPFREDLRPMIGIFHANFVMFRLILAFSNSSLKSEFKGVFLEEALLKYRKGFEDTKKVLLNAADLTELGSKFFRETSSCIEGL